MREKEGINACILQALKKRIERLCEMEDGRREKGEGEKCYTREAEGRREKRKVTEKEKKERGGGRY